MAPILAAQTAEITPEIIAQEALGVLRANLHLTNNVTKEAEVAPAQAGQVANKGKVVSIPKLGALDANEKTPNASFTVQAPDMSPVQLTIDQHWECTIAVDDYAQAIADRNIEDTYLGDMVTALAEKIETMVAGESANFTNTPIDATGGLTEDKVLEARKVLTDMRAPMENRFGYWDSAAVNALLKIDRFTAVEKYGANASIQNGELGKIHGFRNFESIFVPSSGSPAEYGNILMHKRAIVLAMRPLPTPRGGGVKVSVIQDPVSGLMMRALYSYNADKGYDQLTLDVLFGVGVYRPELGVVVTTS